MRLDLKAKSKFQKVKVSTRQCVIVIVIRKNWKIDIIMLKNVNVWIIEKKQLLK